MRVDLGFIRLHKFLYGTDEDAKMYNIIPTIFLGLMKSKAEKDWIIGIDWLLWSLYIQIGF